MLWFFVSESDLDLFLEGSWVKVILSKKFFILIFGGGLGVVFLRFLIV